MQRDKPIFSSAGLLAGLKFVSYFWKDSIDCFA